MPENPFYGDDAADARHDTPPTRNPFTAPNPPDGMTYRPIAAHHAPLAPGLHFVPDGGPALRDLGRIDWADNAHTGGARIDTLTLRVIEAHMIEAQARLRNELNRRRRGSTFGPVGPDIDE